MRNCRWCSNPDQTWTLEAVERAHILNTLWRMNANRTYAALALGISLRTLRYKLAQYKAEGEIVPDATYIPYAPLSEPAPGG